MSISTIDEKELMMFTTFQLNIPKQICRYVLLDWKNMKMIVMNDVRIVSILTYNHKNDCPYENLVKWQFLILFKITPICLLVRLLFCNLIAFYHFWFCDGDCFIFSCLFQVQNLFFLFKHAVYFHEIVILCYSQQTRAHNFCHVHDRWKNGCENFVIFCFHLCVESLTLSLVVSWCSILYYFYEFEVSWKFWKP